MHLDAPTRWTWLHLLDRFSQICIRKSLRRGVSIFSDGRAHDEELHGPGISITRDGPLKGILHCLFNVNVRMRKAGNVKVDKIDKVGKVDKVSKTLGLARHSIHHYRVKFTF